MLCFEHSDKFGEICTNRCKKRPTCTKKRIPLLIEALDILASDIEVSEGNNIFFTSFKSYCIAPEAYINKLVFSMQEQEPPRLTMMSCSYPGCDGSILLPRSQKRELLSDNYLKYNKNTYVYCSKDCQERHLKELAKSKSVASGTLKNHEYALKIYGADTTKRLKEREKEIITGNVTEQRARCLRDKLISMAPRHKKKYLTPKEIQSFLLNELPENLKVHPVRIHVTTSEIVNKTKQLFPDEISIEKINKRTRIIVYMK